MLNLDHFGSLNETYGQEVGDAILRRVGDALLRAARESDTPARYTGDEFAVLLPACPRHESFKAAARMRELVSAVESVRPITISAGIATYPAHAHTPEGLVRAAGEALYEAKLAGRDRVMRSTRGSLYRSNERRQTLGKDQVARLHDRRKSAPAPTKIVKREPVAAAVTEPRSSRMLVTAQPPPAAQPVTKPKPEPQPEVVETVNAEASPTTMLVTAQPPPASVAKTTLNYSEVEARLRQIATARIAG
jgi:diguanylate cyclase (GGDEF)-like protein